MYAEDVGDPKQRGNAGVTGARLDALQGSAGDAGSEIDALLGEVTLEAGYADAVADAAALGEEPVVVIG